MNQTTKLPLLAVRDVVVYPDTQIAIFVGRAPSVQAVNVAQDHHDSTILLVSQTDAANDEISTEQLHSHGTLCRIISTMPHDTDKDCLKVLLEGEVRAKIVSVYEDNGSFFGEFLSSPVEEEAQKTQKRMDALLELFGDYADSHLRSPRELMKVASGLDSLTKLIYFIATRVNLPFEQKLALIAIDELDTLYETLLTHLIAEKAEQSLEGELAEQVRRQMESNQREYYLNEKMKAIKSELADLGDGFEDEDDELELRLKEADLPDDVRKKAEVEFKKLKMMPAASSEASVVRGYLEWILDTPWNKTTKTAIKLDKAKEVLDKDHYGLEEVKDRILEYLAVQARIKQIKGPILCLVGPPGVGKTSLGESIARATGRKFVRMALGGVRDEAEIRGHRRTYIGAMPGKIVQSLAKIETKNPLFLLDEIDKMAQDFRGDPASALLEVLDPSQNKAFNDHYLDLDLDLSQVMFVCTANSMNIPPALLDRMEVIRLSGYTEDEKMHIAQEYLLPRTLKDNGLKAGELDITDNAITSIIRHYTREAGVRGLERELSKISRKAVRKVLETKNGELCVNDDNIADYLGVKPFDYGLAEKDAEIGRITGLAWTSVGGELLTIETATMAGKGELVFTGSLGDVMKESIRAAMSVVRAGGERYGISYDKIKQTDVHVHMPEGATPKDGPSAGIALTTALVSALTGIAIRPDIAMTGEVTLRGKVLRIGGLKEKLLAAHRGGIALVLIPKANERDLVDIPDNVKAGLTIKTVETMDEVLDYALTQKLMPLPLNTSQTKPQEQVIN